jgi:ABC-2 type transport system permease protein
VSKTRLDDLRAFGLLLQLGLRRAWNRLAPGGRGGRRRNVVARLGIALGGVSSLLGILAFVYLGASVGPRGSSDTAVSVSTGSYGAFQLTFLLAGLFFTALAVRPSWVDRGLGLFIALPLPPRSLAAHLILSSAASRIFWMAPLWALLLGISQRSGSDRFPGALGAAAAAAVLHLILNAFAVAVGLTLRRHLRGRQGGVVAAVSGVLALVAFLCAFAPAVASNLPLRSVLTSWVWGVPTPVVLIIGTWGPDGLTAAGWGLLAAEISFLLVVATALSSRQLRHGVLSRPDSETRVQAAALGAYQPEHRRLGPLAHKELLTLSRDYGRLATSVLMPLMVPVSMTVMLIVVEKERLTASTTAPCLLALGTAFVVLLSRGTNAVAADRPTLWMFLSLPISMTRYLLLKAVSAGALAFGSALVVAATFIQYSSGSWLGLATAALWAGVGVVLMAPMTVSVAVLSFDKDTGRPHPARLYAYGWLQLICMVFLAFAAGWGTRVSNPVVLATMWLAGLAFWQRATHRLPWLLDTEDPPSRRRDLSLKHGFVVLILVVLGQRGVSLLPWIQRDQGTLAVIAVLLWVGVGVLLAHLILRLRRVGPLPRVGRLSLSDVLFTLLLAMAIAVLGWTISWLLARTGGALVPYWPARSGPVDLGSLPLAITFVLVTVVVAPIAEEYLYRGLIFGGLRRSFGRPFSVIVSATIFSTQHPIDSQLPVWVVGCAYAMVVKRDGSLARPMLMHMAYNATILLLRWYQA